MDSEKILKNILRMNFNIKDNFLSQTKFEDEFLEEKFQEYIHVSTYKKNLISFLVIILGYLATLFYSLIAFKKTIYMINFIICFFLAIISLIISSVFRSRKVIIITNHFQIFLCSLNMISKGYILCFYFNNSENDNVEELMRIIIYDFFATNIYLITKLEANIFISIFYFLLNFSLIVLGHTHSLQNRFYFLEGFTSFCTFSIFYALRKQWDFKLRLGFAEQIKFEKYFIYTIDYLDGLNGYNINVRNNRMVFYGTKTNSLMKTLVEENFLLNCSFDNKNEYNETEKKPIANEFNNGLNNQLSLKSGKNLEIKNKTESENKLSFEVNDYSNENMTISLLKNLIFYKKYEMDNPLSFNFNLNESNVSFKGNNTMKI